MQRNNLPNSIENLSKINQKTSFLRAPNPIAFSTRFWIHFGTILGPFWEALGSICLHVCCPEASGGAFWESARPSWGFLGRFRTSKPQFWSILDQFGAILEPFWRHFGCPGPHFGRSDLHFGAPGAPFGRLRHDFTPPSL